MRAGMHTASTLTLALVTGEQRPTLGLDEALAETASQQVSELGHQAEARQNLMQMQGVVLLMFVRGMA